MNKTLLPAFVALGLVYFASAAPLAGQTSLSLLGDKDCFGIGGACLEGVDPRPPNPTSTASDPSFTDRILTGFAGDIFSWTHFFTPTSVFGALLTFRTVGLADVGGPYDVFVDALLVGTLPLDGFGHFDVETFTFALAPSILADGMATVSFTTCCFIGAFVGDGFSIDYSEITVPTVSVPEPGALLLVVPGLFGLVFVGRRRREAGLAA